MLAYFQMGTKREMQFGSSVVKLTRFLGETASASADGQT